MEILLLILAVIVIIYLTTRLTLHPFLALFLVSIAYALAVGMPLEAIILAINDGFGGTLGKIGLIIVLGIIIGAFLEHSGGARTLAEKVLKWIGYLLGGLVVVIGNGNSGLYCIHSCICRFRLYAAGSLREKPEPKSQDFTCGCSHSFGAGPDGIPHPCSPDAGAHCGGRNPECL